jgi:hypothetical protein
MNAKKHLRVAIDLDPCSSASRFDGWKTPLETGPPNGLVVEIAETWLLKTGWKRHGLIGRDERPARGSTDRSVDVAPTAGVRCSSVGADLE